MQRSVDESFGKTSAIDDMCIHLKKQRLNMAGEEHSQLSTSSQTDTRVYCSILCEGGGKQPSLLKTTHDQMNRSKSHIIRPCAVVSDDELVVELSCCIIGTNRPRPTRPDDSSTSSLFTIELNEHNHNTLENSKSISHCSGHFLQQPACTDNSGITTLKTLQPAPRQSFLLPEPDSFLNTAEKQRSHGTKMKLGNNEVNTKMERPERKLPKVTMVKESHSTLGMLRPFLHCTGYSLQRAACTGNSGVTTFNTLKPTPRQRFLLPVPDETEEQQCCGSKENSEENAHAGGHGEARKKQRRMEAALAECTVVSIC